MPPDTLQGKLLLNTHEVCAYLNIKPKKLYQLIDRRLLRKHPSFRKMLIARAEVERFATLGTS